MEKIIVGFLFVSNLFLINYCGYDLYSILKEKLIGRFFEGRISDDRLWGERVESICKKWLLKTPTVCSTDKHLTLIDILFKKFRRGSIQVWQTASLYISLNENAENREMLKDAEKIILKKHYQNSICDSDYGILAFALSDNAGDFKDKMLKYVLANKTDDAIVFYKSHAKNAAFVDTLGFICPFLVKIGVETGNAEYIDLAKHQFEMYFKYGMEQNSSLPFHAFDVDSHTQLGVCDWSRGLAWLLIGLMDSYKVLLSVGIHDEFFEKQIIKYADIVSKFQNNYGGYSWRLMANYNTDSSATAVFGWFLACAANIFHNEDYLSNAKKCREFLKSKTRNNGIIDSCQGDTMGIGNYSRSFNIMPFAQGFALRMNKEIDKC